MNDNLTPDEFLESIDRLSRDLRSASITLSTREARFLVDAYYAMQRDRIRAAHQNRTLADNAEPHDVLVWLFNQRGTLEKQIARALDAYSAGMPAGRWARSITGIGPIISAGLIANIYVGHWCRECHGRSEQDCNFRQSSPKFDTKAHQYQPEISCPTVGHIWRYAGLDPTDEWKKGEVRPWNASLKRLCYLIGESFVKVSNLESDIYGKIYKTRKDYENANNEKGLYESQARAALAAKRFGLETEARKHYQNGMLPPAQIHRRSCRYAVKLFLAHLHHVMYEMEFKSQPPKPWIISHGGHTHFLPPPNWG